MYGTNVSAIMTIIIYRKLSATVLQICDKLRVYLEHKDNLLDDIIPFVVEWYTLLIFSN